MEERPARHTRAADHPWDLHRAPISSHRYSCFLPPRLNFNSQLPLHSANNARIPSFESAPEAWRRGTYRRQDEDHEVLALSRYNALISARMYLERNPSEFEHRHPYDGQVRSPSCFYRPSWERDWGDSLRSAHGEGYNSGKRTREVAEERNSSPPPSRSVSISSPRSRSVNHGGIRETAGIDVKNGDDDDELEEGQLTPSSGSCHKQEEGSNSFSSCKPEMGGENENECAEEELMFPVRFRENSSCAIDVTSISKRKMKNQKGPSQIKKVKTKQNRSGRESHVIVVCGKQTDSRIPYASGLHQNDLFVQGGSSLSHFTHRENDSRMEESVPNDGPHVALNQGCNSGSPYSARCNAKAAARRRKSNTDCIEASDCLKNFSPDSAHGSLGCHALQECKPLEQSPQEAMANGHGDIMHLKDVQVSPSGLASEMPGQFLQGDQSASVFEFAKQCKLQQNLDGYQDVRTTADLSVLVQPTIYIGPQAVHTVDNNCQGSVNYKGDNHGCSMTGQEVEDLRYTESFKDQGSFLTVGVTDNQITEVCTFHQENIFMPHKESVLQATEVDRGWRSEVSNSQTTMPLWKHSLFDSRKNVKPLGLANSSIPSLVLNFEPKIAGAGADKTNKDKGVARQPGMHSSNLQVEEIFPVNDLLLHSSNKKLASGTDECNVSLQNFISKSEGCSLKLNAVVKSREIGKPCFTEATTVSSLVPNSAPVSPSTVLVDSHFTTSEAKQLVDMTFTAKSDSSMAELKIKSFQKMPPTAKLDFSTVDSEARHEKLPAASFMVKQRLSSNAPSNFTELQNIGTSSTCLHSSRSYSTDLFCINERSHKKLKAEDTANLVVPYLASSVSSREFNTSFSQVTMVTKPRCQNLTLRSDASQQQVSSPSKGVKRINKSSQNAFKAPLLPMSSTAYLHTRSKEAGHSVHALRTQTWTRHGSLLEPAAKVLSATSEIRALSNKAGSQHISYVRRGNSLVRASGPPMGMYTTEWDVSSGCVRSGQIYSSKSSYTRNISSTHGMAKVVPRIVKRVAANNDRSMLNIGGFVSPSVWTLPQDMKLQVSNTVLPESSADRVMTVSSGRVETLHPRFPIISAVDVSNADLLDEVKTSVGSHVMNIPTSYIPVVESNQSGDSVINFSAEAEAYKKCKSNQLLYVPVSKCQASTASINKCVQLQFANPGQDHYYTKNTYQLLQSSTVTDTKSTTSVQISTKRSPPEAFKEMKALALKTQRRSRAYQTKLGRVLKQTKRATSRFSRTWTLNGAHPSLVTLPRVQTKKMVALLLPWKRPAYIVAHSRRTNSLPNVSKGSSLILISEKLRCLRRRQTCYSRSAILRLGGSNLKWTKSTEKHYRKSNQEANIAAATVKREREEKDGLIADVDIDVKEQADMQTACKVSQGLKLHDGERIVYVGLSRYKMDPSKNTLQRIPGSSCNSGPSYTRLTTDTATVFTPRRSSIGGIEYVRVGNGNQLIRDPKAVSRALASEKVRRSLHTLRCGQVKKQKYCQFFSRFGKCDKENGRCPYNHDSEKVAICKKFLKGTCSNLNCRLTHKVIPEQLPDCLYFLLGFCTLENCCYRHVNVSPNAPICDGFLKGFCVDGDECNKKHTYVCSQYASARYCSERSTCKLQHPKKKIKAKLPSNAHRKGGKCQKRYFMSLGDLDHSQSPSTAVDLNGTVKHGMKVISREDESADFISVNSSEEDSNETNITGDDIGVLQRVCSLAFGDLQLPTNDYDRLIKPVLLLQSQV